MKTLTLIATLLFSTVMFSSSSYSGFFWDSDPKDCYKSKIGSCSNEWCKAAMRIGCEKKFSSNNTENRISKCIIGHARSVRGRAGLGAVVGACTWNMKCGTRGIGGIGWCLLDSLDEIYSGYDYKTKLGRCSWVEREVQGKRFTSKPGC